MGEKSCAGACQINEKIYALIEAGKSTQASLLIRSLDPRVGLKEAKMIVQAFSDALSGDA